MPASNTSIVPAVRDLRLYLESKPVLAELKKALPRGLSAQRLVRQTISLAQKNPELLDCTQLSILVGMMAAAELGLELTGPLGHAYLIPRWNGKLRLKEASFQVGWKGLVALAYRSGSLGSITVRTVCELDEFDYDLGTAHRIHHKVARSGERGPATHYYAIAFFGNGSSDFEVWTRQEIESHRLKYSPPPANKADRSAWATNWDAMARKTVVRALCTRLSLCPEAQHAATLDEYVEAGVESVQPSRNEEVLARLEQVSAAATADEGDSEEATDAEVLDS